MNNELWAVHAQGPDDIYPAYDLADAERHAAELNAIPTPPGISVAAVVIPSPLAPLEHWKGVAELEREHKLHLLACVAPTDANLTAMRKSGLSIDGDNAYKRDLLDAVVGALAFGKQRSIRPPAGHWLERFYQIGQAEADERDAQAAAPLEELRAWDGGVSICRLSDAQHLLAARDAKIEALTEYAAAVEKSAETAEQERDQLRARVAELKARAPAIPEGYALVPARMELLPEDIAAIMFYCGGDEDATEVDEMYVGGVLWVGDVQDDDGNKVYGLHIACGECLEEGSTPVVEFPRLSATSPEDWCPTMQRQKAQCGCPDCGSSLVQVNQPSPTKCDVCDGTGSVTVGDGDAQVACPFCDLSPAMETEA